MRVRPLLALAIIIFPAIYASAQSADSAKAFLLSVYKQYQNGGKGINFTGPHAGRYYHSSLLALIRTDLKNSDPDSVPDIDFDPICGCQDWEGIWNLQMDMHVETPRRALARISFAVLDPRNYPHDALTKLEITLVPERGEWRIYDIVDESDPHAALALRKDLQRDIENLRRSASPQAIR
jgi:hypothetical protein